ncbi:MAG: extracellular solute-binding protein [Lachnospiraceae bacterium]|jgi:iron(III) transport system substrate-binding protein|nr:extracellular solute-binding protein [Lachnospiraceae bacterium]
MNDLTKGFLLLTVLTAPILSGCAVKAEQPLSVGEPRSTSANTAEASVSVSENTDDKLVICTPHDADPMNAAISLFMSEYPDIRVEVLAAGTGELIEKLQSESAAPTADVLWGGGADSLAAHPDLFESYICANNDFIDAGFKAADYKWTGESPLPMVIIYNKKRLSEEGISAPKSWQDCLKPEFKGEIAYCRPSKSGSAYTQLCTMILANGGKTDGWDYVEKFVKNLDGHIFESSSKCHKMVASGDYLIGITIEKSALTYRDDPNIGFCYPTEGTSAVPDAISIVKGCPDEKNAKLFVDFVTSKECQAEQRDDWDRRPVRNDMKASAALTDLRGIKLIDYDFSWAAADKDEIITRFDRIFDASGS